VSRQYAVIIVGAGSIGVPTAMALAELGVKTLVLDRKASPGQGENKRAIGGMRATHGNSAKILTCLRSIEIVSTWHEKYGDDIHWVFGGYTFPVFREQEEKALKGLLPLQKEHGLNIDWVDAKTIKQLAPGINSHGLMGGTHSPRDGHCMPLLTIDAFYRRAVSLGAEFHFRQEVKAILTEGDKVRGVLTSDGEYLAPVVLDAAGPHSPALVKDLGIDFPVQPDSHEALVTEPVQPFFKTMLVDLRPGPDSSNFYFYQNMTGHVIGCMTPRPLIKGLDTRETSTFLPSICRRMIDLMPCLQNLRVRRVWRGLYPMSPDGSPLVGWSGQVEGLLHASGMCGQGFMIGPGLGEVLARLITNGATSQDQVILKGFDINRDLNQKEALQ
jgi:sarcosine oxidase subunit beta